MPVQRLSSLSPSSAPSEAAKIVGTSTLHRDDSESPPENHLLYPDRTAKVADPSVYSENSVTSTATPNSGLSHADRLVEKTTSVELLDSATESISPTGRPSSSPIASRPTATRPCNNYLEFCNRRYSNITEICAHNSPFARRGNLASNQDYGVLNQLNDGIRMCKPTAADKWHHAEDLHPLQCRARHTL